MSEWARRVRTWLGNPFLVAAIVALIWLAHRVPRLSADAMEGPDMPAILGALESDHSLGAVASWFAGPWVQCPNYYRPLTSLVHLMDFLVWGRDPWGWRLTNALIIAVTIPALVWLCSAGLGRPWAGVVAGAALLLQPLTRQMTVWPAWRTDAICGLFLCIATGAGLSWIREGHRAHLWLSLVALLLAILSKEPAFIWPAFAAVAALALGHHVRGGILVLSSAALAAAMWLLRIRCLGHPLMGAPIVHVQFTLSRQLWQLVMLLFYPVAWNLSFTYPAILGEAYSFMHGALYKALLTDLLVIAANVVLLLHLPRIWVVIWAWRLIMYLPSMPFANLYAFYRYIPTLGDALLYGVAVSAAAPWLGRFARERFDRRRAASARSEV